MCHFYACFWFRKQRGNLCFWQVVEIRNCTSTVVSDTVLRHTRYSVDDLQLTLFSSAASTFETSLSRIFLKLQVTPGDAWVPWNEVKDGQCHLSTCCDSLSSYTVLGNDFFFFFCQVCPFKSPNVVDALSLWNDTHTEEGRETHQ